MDDADGEVSFRVASEKPLFWSLPEQFLGDKVTSYTGNLTVTQRFDGTGGVVDDSNVIVVGNGVSIHWKIPDAHLWRRGQDKVTRSLSLNYHQSSSSIVCYFADIQRANL